MNKFLDLNSTTFDVSGCVMTPPMSKPKYRQDSYDPKDYVNESIRQSIGKIKTSTSEGTCDPMPAFRCSLTDWPITHAAYPRNTQLKFFGTDSEQLFLKNKKRLPTDWMYHDKEIIYNFNNEALRQKKDLKDINMDNYIYFTGACYTTGIGVNEEDRHSDLVSKKLGMDYVTWSAPMAGLKLQVLNFINYLKVAPKPPKILVVEHVLSHIYPQYSDGEFLLYYQNEHVADPSRFPEHLIAYQTLLSTDFYYQESVMWRNIAKTFCDKLGIKFLEISFYTGDPFIRDHGIPHLDRTTHEDDINYAFARDYRKSSQGNPYASHMGVGIYKEMTEILLKLI